MLDRLTDNRSPAMNVLSDRNVTSVVTAQKLEVSECEWTAMENMVLLLKPVHVLTTVLCDEKKSLASMVRPQLPTLMQKHMLNLGSDDFIYINFKHNFTKILRRRLNLEWDPEIGAVSER
jgi:hypothetical protein